MRDEAIQDNRRRVYSNKKSRAGNAGKKRKPSLAGANDAVRGKHDRRSGESDGNEPSERESDLQAI